MIRLLNPNDGQKGLLRLIRDSKAKNFVVKASRQSGKSTLMLALAVEFALSGSNNYVLYITPTYSLGKQLFRNILVPKLRDYLNVENINLSSLEAQLPNGSIIRFMSGESENSIRGLS